MQLVTLILSLAWPVAKKVLVALGIGWATYSGLGLIADQIRTEVVSAWGMIGGASLQILTLAGVPQAVGIVLGGFAAGASMAAVTRLTKVAS